MINSLTIKNAGVQSSIDIIKTESNTVILSVDSEDSQIIIELTKAQLYELTCTVVSSYKKMD